MNILVNDRLDLLDWAHSLNLLPPWRREKALRYVQESDRRQSVGVWLLLREACLQQGLEDVPEVAFGQHGKPFFPDYPLLHFNLSHCEEAVVCAVSDQSVGIDVECIRPIDPEVFSRVLSPQEQAQVLAAPSPETAFAILWTRKESLLKLTGEGLVSRLDTLLNERSGICFETVAAPEGKYVYTSARFSASE